MDDITKPNKYFMFGAGLRWGELDGNVHQGCEYVSYQSRMTGIFKSRWLNNKSPMKHLGLGHILLLIGMGLLLGQAAAELTAFQSLTPSATVGQMVTVTVSLTYNGQTPTQAVVTPSLPFGLVANAGQQSTDLYPGVTQQISYPLTAEQSGSYWIVSDINYAEGGAWRNLRLEAPFTAVDSTPSAPQQSQQVPLPGMTPGMGQDGSYPGGSYPGGADQTTDPTIMPQDGGLPNKKRPGNMNPANPGTEPGNNNDEPGNSGSEGSGQQEQGSTQGEASASSETGQT
ncbi:MAG TPA: hypothetical protein PKV33_09925 [Methanothrix sp.]|nr:hypothetical protein [Methanothrix sp.]